VERFQLGMGIPHRKFGQQIGKVTFHLICPDDAAGFCVGWDTAQFALIVKEDAAMEAAFRKFQQRGEQQNVFSVLYHRIVKGLAISQVIEARPGGCFNLTMDNTILVTLKKHKQPLLMQQQKAAVDALQGCAHLGLQLQQMKMTSNQAAQAGKGQLVGILYFGSRGFPRPALKKFGHEGILLTFFSFFDYSNTFVLNRQGIISKHRQILWPCSGVFSSLILSNFFT
jgi:hypothetical protein